MQYKPVCTMHAHIEYFTHVLAVTLSALRSSLKLLSRKHVEPSLSGLHAVHFWHCDSV